MAYRGQMANVTSRLMGEQFVNAEGSAAMPHLTHITDSFGPMLSEYGAHGGSVAKVDQGEVFSLEGGQTEANYQAWRKLGYVVVPAEEANARGLATLGYEIDDEKGYATVAPAKTETPDS